MNQKDNFDKVSAPSHYYKGGMWCETVIKAITSNLIGFEAVCVANIVKYLWRYKTKNGLEDVEKAKKYTEMLIEYLKNNIYNGSKEGSEKSGNDTEFSDRTCVGRLLS